MVQIGRFDELGSRVRNVNKYLPLYAHGAKPVFKETDHWNSDNRLRVSLMHLNPLYTLKEPFRLDIAEARFHILKLAFELHKDERYYASIPLVISQLDGICADVTHEPAKCLFQKKFFNKIVTTCLMKKHSKVINIVLLH